MATNIPAETFALQPIPTRARMWLNAITLYLLAQAAIVFWLVSLQPVVMTLAGLTTLAIAGFMLWFANAPTAVRITDGSLILRLPLYGRAIPLADIVPGSVQAVTPDTDPAWRMTLRTNGLAVPGYRLGWFRTAGAGRTLVAQTGPTALAFHTRAGFAVLLSVTDPDALARALDRHAA